MHNPIRTAGLSSLLVILVAGAQDAPYSSKDGNFRAAFPSAPKTSKQTNAGPGGVKLTANSTVVEDRSKKMFSVIYVDYPAADLVTLDTVMDSTIKAVKMRPTSRREITLDGHPGREVVFEVDPPKGLKEKGVGHMRCYLVGKRVYQVLVVGPKSKLSADDMAAFVGSFSLLNAVAPAEGMAPGEAPPAVAGPMVDRTEPGMLVDPDGDCKITPARSGATIFVPAKVHDLSPVYKLFNAPRLMREVNGDFTVEVRAAQIDAEGQALREGIAYRGAGLVFWQDKDHYVRFERAAIVRDGQRQAFLFYAKSENGQEVGQGGNAIGEVAVTLKLERKGGQLFASFNDGGRWQDLKPMDIASWPATGQIGVEAINATAKPLTAQFEAFKLRAAALAGPAAKGVNRGR